MKTIMLAVLVASAVSPQQVAGRWSSEGAEDLGNGSFAKRTFVITDSKWSLDFTLYGDKALTVPLLTFSAEGPWRVVGPSAKVPGASEAEFDFASKKLTLHSKDPNVAKGFGVDGCGLVVGKATDVSKAGCSFVPSVEKYGREYDLVKLDGATLQLGARPADNDLGSVEKRPAALGAKLKRAK